jgi:hypothetical protein
MRGPDDCFFDPNPETNVSEFEVQGSAGTDGPGPCREAARAGFTESGYWVRRGDKFLQVFSSDVEVRSVLAVWSPEGTRIAFLTEDAAAGRHTQSSASVEVALGPPIPFELRANPELVPERLDAIARSLAADYGQRPLRTGAADTVREKTVIYVRPGHEAEASALACLLPGDTTTAKLDWKTDADVVIGLGKSAAAGK